MQLQRVSMAALERAPIKRFSRVPPDHLRTSQAFGSRTARKNSVSRDKSAAGSQVGIE
jgi:hypothetical protein